MTLNKTGIINTLLIVSALFYIFYINFTEKEDSSNNAMLKTQKTDNFEMSTNLSSRNREEEAIAKIFKTFLWSEKNCDITLANELITSESKKIMHYTCSNMANEYKCYKDLKDDDYDILVMDNQAIIHFYSYSKMTGWPIFFKKEKKEWKIDYNKMAFGVAMIGGGCSTGWNWKNNDIEKEFCNYFKPLDCPSR